MMVGVLHLQINAQVSFQIFNFLNNSSLGNQWYGCQRTSAGRRGGNVFNPIQSARLRTVNSFSFKYGVVEIRAKMPRGDWIWPAIWLLPVHNNYGQWPASGEIDLVESRGNVDFDKMGVQQMGSTLHWGPHSPENGYPKTHQVYNLPSGDSADKFRTFKFYWSPERMITFVDDKVVLNVTINESFWTRGNWDKTSFNNPWANRPKNKFGVSNAPFDQKYYLILNVAVGGTADYWPDGISPNKPWNNKSPHAVNEFYNAKDKWYPTWKGEDAAMVIDYIKIDELEK